MVRLCFSQVAVLDGEDSAWSEVQSAALDGVPGTGNASDDGEALDDTESLVQSASAAADSAASVDCRCLHHRQPVMIT